MSSLNEPLQLGLVTTTYLPYGQPVTQLNVEVVDAPGIARLGVPG